MYIPVCLFTTSASHSLIQSLHKYIHSPASFYSYARLSVIFCVADCYWHKPHTYVNMPHNNLLLCFHRTHTSCFTVSPRKRHSQANPIVPHSFAFDGELLLQCEQVCHTILASFGSRLFTKIIINIITIINYIVV